MSIRRRFRPQPTPTTSEPQLPAVPAVLPQILLEAVSPETLVMTINGDRLAATPIRSEAISQTVTELVARFNAPTRVEVRELDGSIHADILTPPAPRSPYAPPDQSTGAARVPSLLEFTASGFIAGEDVALALILRHASADPDGNVRALLDRGELPTIAGEVILIGRISGTTSVQSIAPS